MIYDFDDLNNYSFIYDSARISALRLLQLGAIE